MMGSKLQFFVAIVRIIVCGFFSFSVVTLADVCVYEKIVLD
jgi:hypothetical protein